MDRLSGSKRASDNIIMSDSQVRKRTKLFKKPYGKRPSTSTKTTKLVTIRQVSNLGNVSGAAVGETLGVLKFNLDDIPGYSDLAAVFDQYKIDKVMLRFVPNGTQQAMTPAPVQRSVLYTAFDPNDATAASTLNELIQYQNCSMTPYLEEYKRVVYPRVAVNSSDAEGQVTLSAAGTWCATNQKDVDWYGLKWGVSANGYALTYVQSWNIHAQFYMSFKNIK